MKSEWTVEITPKRKWYDFNLKEVIQYRDLIVMFVKRNFTSQYKQTILGPMWFILNPLITSVISTVVFGGIAGIETDGVPYFLYYLSGFVLWNYFATCVTQTSNTFIANSAIMGKVYFPRISMPIASVIYSAINMAVVFVMTVIVMVIYSLNGLSLNLGINVLMIPVLILQTAALGLGVGIIISSLTTRYRDLAILVGFGMNLWMYATPIVYPVSLLSPKMKMLIMINPMSPVINGFHNAMLGIGNMEWGVWGLSVVMTLIILMFGILLFNKVEKTFMDTV